MERGAKSITQRGPEEPQRDTEKGREGTVGLGGLDDALCHAVLDAAAGVEELSLGVDILAAKPRQGRIADQLANIGINLFHNAPLCQ